MLARQSTHVPKTSKISARTARNTDGLMDSLALAATWDVELGGLSAADLALSYVLARNHGSFLPLTARTIRNVVVVGDSLPGLDATSAEVSGADLVVVNFGGDHEVVTRVAEANPRTVVVLSERVEMPWLIASRR